MLVRISTGSAGEKKGGGSREKDSFPRMVKKM